MSHLIRICAGVSATALALALAFAFWPRTDRIAAIGRQLVEQPVFVARPAAAKPEPKAVAQAPAVAAPAQEESALAKLAVALRTTSTTSASPDPGASGAVAVARSVNPPAAGDEARRFCAEGLVALAQGDIVGARAYLRRAAEEGDARALLALGETYDPTTLAQMGARGIKGDAATARDYYAKALAAGVGDARERMASLSPAQ